jgi:hypothetical protein
LNAEQLEALRMALGHWIEDNERCILDDMKDFPRADWLNQLNYHVMLSALLDEICSKEEQAKDMCKEWRPIPEDFHTINDK